MRVCEGQDPGTTVCVEGGFNLEFEFDKEGRDESCKLANSDLSLRAESDESDYSMYGTTHWVTRPPGHKGMICSRCCAERGPDGDVWCLGCLKAVYSG